MVLLLPSYGSSNSNNDDVPLLLGAERMLLFLDLSCSAAAPVFSPLCHPIPRPLPTERRPRGALWANSRAGMPPRLKHQVNYEFEGKVSALRAINHCNFSVPPQARLSLIAESPS